MKKTILALSTALLLSLTSCSDNTSQTATADSSASSSSPSQSTDATETTQNSTTASYPRTVTLLDGSEYTFESAPETIASMVFGTDEMLIDITDLDKIVGLSGKDNGVLYKSDPSNESQNILKINDNAEILADLCPDAVIGASWTSAELQELMRDMDIPFYGYTTPKTLAEIIQIVEDIGYFLGEDEKSLAITEDMTQRLEAVTDITSKITEKVEVMAYNIHGSSSAKGTLFDDMVSLAGGINLSTEAGLEGTATISKEQLVDMNPEVIILVKWAKDTTEDFEAYLDEMMNDESLSTISAIENNRVYLSLDNSITNISHFAIDGLEFIAESCYPDLF